MNRPLIISDCDEVLLHMMVPFRQWLDEAHRIHFTFGTAFEEAFRHKDSRDPVARELVWDLLGECPRRKSIAANGIALPERPARS